MAMEDHSVPEEQPLVITADRLKEAEKYIEEEEGVTRRLSGFMETFITIVAVVMSLYHLYAAVATVTTQILRGVHVAFVLFLGFLVFPLLGNPDNASPGTIYSWPCSEWPPLPTCSSILRSSSTGP